MAEQFDVAVMGGGPAGAVTALCLSRNGWRVALFECKSFHEVRTGETLPPEINPVLQSLGLWNSFLSQSPLQSPGVISMWGSSVLTEVDFTANAFGCGWHVDRRHFDPMLCEEAARAGTTLFLNRSVRWTREAGIWRAGKLRSLILVDATGRNRLPLDDKNNREREDLLLAVVLQISNWSRQPLDLRTCIESTPAGWWYSTLLPDGSGLTMFFTGAEIYRSARISLTEQLREAPLTRKRLDGGRIKEPRIVHAPSGRRKKVFDTDWVAVGDSASSYDPLSGRGIFKALSQGKAAAQAIDARLRGNRAAMDLYAAKVQREFEQYARQRRSYYSLEQRWRDQPFWQRRRHLHG
jgi:flavin-dependent dehydrogenase